MEVVQNCMELKRYMEPVQTGVNIRMSILMSSYKGNEPYIFISYAHRDSDKVFPIIQRLCEDSYRVWYDDGVDPGTEWDDNIAGYINRCTVFIAFLSENYISSKNCKDELSYSREIDKSQLLIYLEDLALPDGMKMRLNRLQAIYWYRYDHSDSAYQVLYGAPNMNLCRQGGAPEIQAARPEEAFSGDSGQRVTDPSAKEHPQPPVPPKPRNTLWVLAAVLVLAGIILAAVFWNRSNKPEEMPVQESISENSSLAEDTAASFPGDEPAGGEEAAEETSGKDASAGETAGMATSAEETADMGTSAEETEENGTLAETADTVKSEHVVLTANESMTVREFTAAISTLKDRLAILTGDESYQMTVDGDKINLWLPEDCLAGEGIEYTLRCYLSRKTELYAFRNHVENMEQESSWLGTFDPFHISREDVEQVTVRQGAVTGADSRKLEALGIEEDSYTYIELVLTDDCARRLSEVSESWKEPLAFGQDMELSTWYYFYTVRGNDEKTFYLINADQEKRFSELVQYNLSHETVAYHFQFTLDLDEMTEWERTESPELFAGQHQRNVDEFAEQTITFKLRSYQSDYTTGQWYDLTSALKERLEALEIPYAFALHIEDGSTIATIKCPLNHMGMKVLQLIGVYSTAGIRSGLNERTLYGATFTCSEAESGTVLAELRDDRESGIDGMKFISSTAVNEEDGIVFLIIKDIPCMKTTLSTIVEDGRISFDRICLSEDREITEDSAWFVRFLDTICNGTPLSSSFSLESIQFNPDSEGNIPTSSDFEIIDTEAVQYVKAIEEACPGAEAFTRENDLYVNLHLEIDESLPEKSAELAEKIYRSFDFRKSSYSLITVYLADENDMNLERARIYFRKSYNVYDGDDPGFICAYGFFCSGRLEAYKKAMQETVNTSPFFTSLYKPDEEYHLYDWKWKW